MAELISNRTRKTIIITTIVLLLIIPVFSLALAQGGGIVPACNKTIVDGKFADPCTFNSLVELGNKIIKFFIVIGASLGAISFAWAGWLYVTSGGNPGTLDKAKSIFGKVILGFVLMLAAWLIIKLVLASLGYAPVPGLDFISGLVGQ